MAEKSPWWRSFVGKRRSAARESAREAVLAQQQSQASQSPTCPQVPSEQVPHPSTELTHTGTADQSLLAVDKPPRPSPETMSNSIDDLEPTFNDMSSRRNLRVSRSGRFKEKKRIRVSLPPDDEQHPAKSPAKDGN